ncbi:hypothetical protein [Chryseobacterium sp. MEBOG07]|nr:hypothetical protein [Chryseobacterium sp. MEBOG07]
MPPFSGGIFLFNLNVSILKKNTSYPEKKKLPEIPKALIIYFL